MSSRAVAVALLLAMAAMPARAQRVRGMLRDSVSGEAIPGAVVWIGDATDRFLARSISSDSGTFSVPRLAGSARLHVLRIGFRPRALALGAAADSVLDVRLAPIALQLAAVNARGRRVCPGDAPDSGGLALWTQARAALMATVVARESNPPTIRLFSYVQTLEPVRRTVIDDSSATRQLVADQSYVAARPAWQLARDGYMQESAGERTFYAPDEDVLLDTSFVETHCLHVVTGDARHAGQVGVAFEPIVDRARDTLVDISGVLWIDPAKGALRSLEFSYTGLEPAAKESGGSIAFRVTPRGTTMVDRWQIQSVELASDERAPPSGIRHRLPPRTERTDVRVVHYLRTGGQVTATIWQSAAGESPGPGITGTVSDLDGHPVAGARVWLSGGDDTVSSDAEGRFTVSHLRAGAYVVMGSDSVLARAGVSRALPLRVDVGGAIDAVVRLLFLRRADALRLVCPDASYSPGAGIALVHVVTAAGAGVGSAAVGAYAGSATVPTRTAHANDAGYAPLCGLTVGEPIRVRATSGNAAGEALLTAWPSDVVPLRVVVRP